MLYVATNLMTLNPTAPPPHGPGIPSACLPPVLSITVAAARSDVIQPATPASGSVTKKTFREAQPARRVADTRPFYRLTPSVYAWIMRQCLKLETAAWGGNGEAWAMLDVAAGRLEVIQRYVNERWEEGEDGGGGFSGWRQAKPGLPR